MTGPFISERHHARRCQVYEVGRAVGSVALYLVAAALVFVAVEHLAFWLATVVS